MSIFIFSLQQSSTETSFSFKMVVVENYFDQFYIFSSFTSPVSKHSDEGFLTFSGGIKMEHCTKMG